MSKKLLHNIEFLDSRPFTDFKAFNFWLKAQDKAQDKSKASGFRNGWKLSKKCLDFYIHFSANALSQKLKPDQSLGIASQQNFLSLEIQENMWKLGSGNSGYGR